MPEKLGQNFLINKKVVDKIIEAADLKSDDFILEVGPGKGILTEELAKRAGKVVAVEIDKNLAGLLRNKLRNYENIEIVEEDILKFQIFPPERDSAKAVTNFKFPIKSQVQNPKLDNAGYQLPDTGYKIIANLPYYITSAVIRKFLEANNPPSEMILMVQKEVAERICATPSEIPTFSRGAKRISRGKPGKMSLLAVSVQYYAAPEILFYVEKENFDPVPEVESAVIKISPRPSLLPKGEGDFDKKFFQVVRAGFCAKRKTLANNLANSIHLKKSAVEEKLNQAGINPIARAQELSIEDWKKFVGYFE